MGDAVALIKGEGKNLRRKEKRARIEQIRANLGLSDSQRTPMVIFLFIHPFFNESCKIVSSKFTDFNFLFGSSTIIPDSRKVLNLKSCYNLINMWIES